MADKPPLKISYLDKSYSDARNELLSRVPVVSDGTWTDINNAQLLVALLETFLGLFDMQTFYQDHQSNEAFLETARERKNVIRHCNQVGYRMKSWTPSLGNVVVKLTAEVSNYVSIPQYTVIYSSANVPYFVLTGTYLTNSNPVATLDVAQGTVNSITYTSSGLSDQNFLIPSTTVAEGSISVTVNDESWIEVIDNFAKSGPLSPHYFLRINAQNQFSVVFGDGQNRLGSGMIPPRDATVLINWADTLGPAGNVGANQVANFEESIPNVTVVSSTVFTGGAVPETIEEAKKLSPMLLRSLWRGVHRDDIIALAESFPGIRQVSVLDINDFPLYSFQISYYEVWVVAIPENGQFLSTEMKQELLDYLDERKYVTCDIKVLDPEYIKVDIEATVFKYRSYDDRVVIANIEDALTSMFTIASSPVATFQMTNEVNGLVLGEDMRFSVLISTIQAVAGVAYVNLITPSSDVQLNYKQIAVLGELRINVQEVEPQSESFSMLRQKERELKGKKTK